MATKKLSLQEKIASFFNLNESTFSTILGALVVIVIGILVVNYFRSTKPQITEIAEQTQEATTAGKIETIINEKGEEIPVNLPDTYQVTEGDKLWTIAEKYYGSGYNWVDIATANNLTDADVLLVDQELTMPTTAVRKPVIEAVIEPTISGNSYVVQKGDYLWKIALMAYGDGFQWTKIAEANGIDLAQADYIEIGQNLNIPR